MINGISAYSPYSIHAAYGAAYANRAAQTQGVEKAQPAQRSGMVLAAQKVHQPDVPVQPVTPVRPVSSEEDPAQSGLLRFGSDPAEMAVRMRIQYADGPARQSNAAQMPGAEKAEAPELAGLKGADAGKANTPELMGLKDAGAEKANAPEIPGLKPSGDNAAEGPKSAQEVMEESECETCKERKYQDGSDDPGVSFKTPTSVSPEQAASAVRGHENEHVVREQAKAQREDRKVVSQSVTYHTDICPECGKVYVSGGETRTVTKANTDQEMEQQNRQNQQDPAKPISVLA